MKTLFLDLVSGISGDMFLGAMLDLGVDFGELERRLAALPVEGYHLHSIRRQKAGIAGVQFEVHLAAAPEPAPAAPADLHLDLGHSHGVAPGSAHHHGHSHPRSPAVAGLHSASSPDSARDFKQIAALIAQSPLSPWVKDKAVRVFRRIAVAEGKIHGMPPEEVHFHEVGALDSIVDIVGACIALELLDFPQVLAAPVVEGTGWVRCAHGRFPVPTPATLEILAARGVTVTQCEEPNELVTPTGAALLAEFVQHFGLMPSLRIDRIGYGLGTRSHITRPNVLRAILGEAAPAASPGAGDWESDTIAVLETNLDDLNPEILGHFIEQALAAGALDAFHTPVQMKKSRPGVVLTLLCATEEADRFTAKILRETSAFGVRRTVAERRKLRREFQTVATPFGAVTVKLGQLDGQVVQAAPEFESCRALAAQANVPIKRVYEAALQAYRNPPSTAG